MKFLENSGSTFFLSRRFKSCKYGVNGRVKEAMDGDPHHLISDSYVNKENNMAE